MGRVEAMIGKTSTLGVGATVTDLARDLLDATRFGPPVNPTDAESFVAELAAARIGHTFNQYRRSRRRRQRLEAYLKARVDAPMLVVGEAAGYRGARASGIPFTSERQLTGHGPAEATATIVHGVLAELGLEEQVLLWNVVPTHPGSPSANRPPTRDEVAAGLRFVEPLAALRRVVAVGRIAERALGCPSVRHPSHGGAKAFRSGLNEWLRGSASSEALDTIGAADYLR